MPRFKNPGPGPVPLESGRVLAPGETTDQDLDELDLRHVHGGRLVEIPEAVADPAPVGWDGQKVADLQAEADRRGLHVEGTGKDGNVIKSDLVAALNADDQAASNTTTTSTEEGA